MRKHCLSSGIFTPPHDTDMGKVDVDLLFRMLFVPFTAFMDDNVGYKGMQNFGCQFCNAGVLFGEGYKFVHISWPTR